MPRHAALSGGFLYREINDALNEVFLGGRFESRPLYLVLDNQGRADLADKLGLHEDDVEEHCCSAVSTRLDRAGDPYSGLNGEMWQWVLAGRRGLPPFTALLYTLSHAAELMVSSGNFRASNYYQRLADVVGVPARRLSFHGKSTEPFWKTFSKWLADNDFQYGRPTARAVNANRYVGVAMSQAIVREEDRQRLHEMFEKYGFTGTDEITEVEVEQYVASWVNSSRPTRQFKATWEKAELRPRVCEIVVSEFEEWKGEATGKASGGPGGQRSRLSLALAFQHGLLGRSVAFWFGREAALDPVELVARDGTKLELANSSFGNLATLEPRAAIDLGTTLVRGLVLDSDGEPRYSWNGRAAIPLARSEHGTYWTEANRVSFGLEHLVLARGDDRVRAAIEDTLQQVAIPGYTVATSAELPGLPAGWVLYEGVRVIKSIDELKGVEAVLSPVGNSAGLRLEGGTRLSRGIWHASRPPLATLDAEEAPTTLRMYEGTGNDGSLACEEESPGRQVSLDLSGCVPGSGNAFVEGAANGRVVGSANLLFRSADKPRPLDRQSRGILAYREILSASEIGDGQDGVRGLFSPPVTAGGEPVEILSQYEQQGDNRPADAEDAAPAVLVDKPGAAAIDIAGMTPDQLREIPCGVRGFHWLKYATIPPGYPRYAPVDVECTQCNVAFLHRRQARARQDKTSRRARRVVPPSPVHAREVAEPRLEMDLWLDAASFLGTGTSAAFEVLTAASGLEGWRTATVLRDLSWLGHLDLETGPTHRARAWSVAPPVFSFVGETEAVLAGFRSRSLLDTIEKEIASAGGSIRLVTRAGQPAIVEFRGLDAEDACIALDGVRDPHGRQVGVVTQAASHLAGYAAGAGDSLFRGFRPATLGSEGLQQFDADRCRWRDVDRPGGPGAYRLSQGSTWYIFRDAEGRSFSGPHELVKLAAARSAGVALHAYDAATGRFIARLGCEPPSLLGRALVACSGRLPTVEGGTSVFESVPPAVAAQVLSVLYRGDLPS